jgi:hypothetical protein
MFNSNRKAIRIGSRALALAGAAAAAAVVVGATTSHASSDSHNTSVDPPNTIVVERHYAELPAWHTTLVPKVTCPADHPYLLKQQYNEGSGFRITPGLEFADYNSGFDAAVFFPAMEQFKFDSGPKPLWRATGTIGGINLDGNSVTNWGFTPTNWTMKLHCTSDSWRGYTPG